MFKPIKTLTKRSFKQNRGRNIVAVMAIILTTLMFTTLFVLTQSLNKNMIEMTFRQTGYDAQVSFKGIMPEQAQLIASHPDVKEVGNSIVLGTAENKPLAGRQTEIRWADDTWASHSFAYPSTGSMPSAPNEIALDTIVLKKLGVTPKLGQEITIDWRKDMNSRETTSSTFTLCGYWEGNESLYASMAWVSRQYTDEMTGGDVTSDSSRTLGLYMAQVTLRNDKNIETAMEGILEDTGLTGLEYDVNLAYLPEMNAQAAQESLPMYLGMLLVFVAGYLIIYNIFQISVTADIQFYGKLKTLGTTDRQLKKLIYGQANLLCIAGIPVGIFLGYLLGMVLVPVFISWNDGQTSVSASPVIFIGSALFAWLTVIISCLRPARLASRVSPIEALRYNDAGASGRKKGKKQRNEVTLSSMAWSNLGRNKKRTITVICSLTLGLVLLSSFYAKNAAFDINKYLEGLTISDFSLEDSTSGDYLNGYDPQGTTLNSKLIQQLSSIEGMEATGKLYSHEETINLSDQAVNNLTNFYTEDRLEQWSSYDPSGAQALQDAVSERQSRMIIFGAGGIPLEIISKEQYILNGSIDLEAFASGDYIIAIAPAIEKEEAQTTVMPTYSVGEKITIENKTFTVMAVVCSVSPITDGAPEIVGKDRFSLDFIIPDSTFQTLWPDNTLRRFYLNTEEDSIDTVQSFLDDYVAAEDSTLSFKSRQTMTKQYERQTRSSAVIGNAVSIVIALVGILNFINSMITAIVSRKREFAMIQSVGMTKQQLHKMLVLEGLSYAGLTLLVSYIFSTAAIMTVVRSMTEGGYSTFRFTLMPLAVCTPILLLLAVLIPLVSFKNLEKHSIVERLRM